MANIRIDLNELGLVQVSGSQNADFLQGQLSCDLKEVTAQQSRLGVHCNAKGRILSSFRLFYHACAYYLLLPRTMAPVILEDLQKYALFYDVILKDVSSTWSITGLSGHTLQHDLTQRLGQPALLSNQVNTYQDALILTIPGPIFRAIVVYPSTHSTLPLAIDSIAAPFPEWQYLEIQSGIASIYPATRELFTPHHIHYHQNGGISFSKGCYTGQEVIARMHYLGKLKNQLYRLTMPYSAAPLPGASVLDETGRVQGTVVMSTPFSEEGPPIYYALASLNTAAITIPLWINNTPIDQIESI